MARLKVRNGETVTVETIVAAGDSLGIDLGGAIVRTGGSPAVRLTGGDAILRNAGRIAVEGANGAALLGNFSGVLDLRLSNTGTIEGQSVAVTLASTTGTTGTVRFSNEGTIDGGAGSALAMRDLRATSILVYNAAGATITNAGTADVVRPGHDLTTAIRVDNAGSILAGTVVGASSSGDGVDLQSQDGGVSATIINRATGLIEGGKHAVTGGNEAYIVNEAGGELIGRNGSGINFDTELADGDGAVTVVNYGLISGRYDGFGDGDGDGVDVDYLVNVSNFGRIEGAGADNIDDFGDGIAAGGGVIYNAAGGEIFGETQGILIDDGDRNGAFAATRLVNDGDISADLGTAVRLIGTFDDTIINTGTISTAARFAIEAGDGDDRVTNSGAITGDIDLGGGADIYTGSTAVDGTVFGGAGDDRLTGSALADRLHGGEGRDVLTGGAGDDIFNYALTTDSSATLASADRITDFASGDRIDLSMIDADTGLADDQAFTSIGGAAFSGAAGELRVDTVAGDTVVSGDVNGDAVADFAIVLTGQVDPAIIAFDL